jgi:hypothetical protein
VPLYAVDFSLKRNIDPKTKALGERCWFSDGGISSNFPIHFFDSPIPQWPTFAINLKQPHPEHDTPGSDFVYLPSSCRAGQLVSWHRFNPTRHAVADLVAFVGAIISTMESWRDSLQTRMPGYRNRIAHISLKPNEGGLNLTMPPDLVNELTKRGKKAGEKLRTEFNFSQHVWTRYRSTMSILASYLEKLCDDYEHPAREANAVWEIIKGTSKDKPPCYPWDSEEQRVFAVTATAAAAGMGCDWSKSHHFQKGAPNPEPELSARPNF